MKKLLLPIAALAMIMLPAAANAEQCRDSASGKFAKCGAPGAVPAGQYVARGKPKAKARAAHAMAPTAAAPAATPAKPGFMSMLKPKAKPAPAPTPAATKTARCKGAKGKFVKCGTPGAVPA